MDFRNICLILAVVGLLSSCTRSKLIGEWKLVTMESVTDSTNAAHIIFDFEKNQIYDSKTGVPDTSFSTINLVMASVGEVSLNLLKNGEFFERPLGLSSSSPAPSSVKKRGSGHWNVKADTLQLNFQRGSISGILQYEIVSINDKELVLKGPRHWPVIKRYQRR